MAPIPIMINGLPGNMAFTLADTARADSRFEILPFSLTGPEIQDSETPLGSMPIHLISPDERESALARIIQEHGKFICLDFTHPSAVISNAEFYCAQGLSFVMGTTGGDPQALKQVVKDSTCSAVIAPNMAKQIVGFQAMIQYAAQSFPDLFEGYRLEIKESHQQGKADTSGTAKAMVDYFNRLGVDFDREEIVQERDPARQQALWGVPAAYLQGHAWHTYTLTSPEGSVKFEFTHNVNGRRIYAQGSLDAVVFLQQAIDSGHVARVFSMIDVIGKPLPETL